MWVVGGFTVFSLLLGLNILRGHDSNGMKGLSNNWSGYKGIKENNKNRSENGMKGVVGSLFGGNNTGRNTNGIKGDNIR